MFNTKTLFVIGAGASYEVGLPLGDTLLETIAGDLDYRIEHFNRPTSGNRVLFNAWMQHYGDNNVGMNAVIDAARKIHHAHGFANSIDQFIDTIEVSMKNLLTTRDKGLGEGLSSIIIDNTPTSVCWITGMLCD